MKLRMAGVQYSPGIGQVERNVARIRALVSSLNRPVDLLVLPELAVTGYNFKSAAEIRPYLETQSGCSYQLAKELSERHSCTTVIGYPENDHGTTYNSALVVDQQGRVVYNYRKMHLYYTDEAWGCKENPDRSFASVDLPLGPEGKVVRASIGICMDLNPYQFQAPFSAFEFAMSAYFNDSRLLIVPTAWLDSDSPDITESLSDAEKSARAKTVDEQLRSGTYPDGAVTSARLIDYWILRLFPFLAHPNNGLSAPSHRVTAVIANRTGLEDKTLYGGSSCIMQFDRSVPASLQIDQLNPSVFVVASAGQATDEVVYAEVDV
ncbi:carbon-nitrogen hydrolase [Metschnikowia bicuspidata]|uniref:Carbon-nitrogen hydrolase n=1 Tax=Metschnikowia bicuspidata TaxID=27322 RepID=A0A4P9ZJI6_9ASCO|nr:carbon-nitrogen hydrolase [Metschnikowia bicuspidata]